MRAEVHDQVDVLEVLEEVDEPHDLLVPHLLLNPNLPLQLGLAIVNVSLPARVPRLEVRFGDYLASILLLVRCHFDYAVTGREATFTQILGLDVALRRLLRVINDQVHLLLLHPQITAWLDLGLRVDAEDGVHRSSIQLRKH